MEAEEQRHVAVDPVFTLELLRGLDPFPGGWDLEQYVLLVHPVIGELSDDGAGSIDGAAALVGEAAIHLDAHLARDHLEHGAGELELQPLDR